ncbi:MAG TPA: hypothetical protein VFM05_14385 [Candidatus Saccharimonadales bacterium]|nr:hypothetical protein [Candidatus Saccharimonadales bacterium]
MMKSAIKLVAVLAVLLASFSQPRAVFAAESTQYSGMGANAYFSNIEGCINTDTFVQGLDFQYNKPPGEPQSYVYLTVSQFDSCTGESIMYVEGFTWVSESDFQVSQKQNTAALTATVTGYDEVSQSNVEIYVDLTWTADGPVTRTKTSNHYKFPGCHINEKFTQMTRTGVAYGSVSDGETNFTPQPSWSASIWEFKSGSVDVGCD